MISSNSFQFERLKDLRKSIYREAKIAKSEKILDVGAGDLKISKEIADASKKDVFAVDIQKPAEIPENVFFVESDALNLPFSKNSFDLVCASFFFVWVDVKKALKEIKRVLREDGKILILSEPIYKERKSTANSNFEKIYLKGLKTLGANFNLEEDLKKNLADLDFKFNIKKTEGKTLVSKNELFEEIDFLFKNKLIDKSAQQSMKEEAETEYEVFLPILYGWAFLL